MTLNDTWKKQAMGCVDVLKLSPIVVPDDLSYKSTNNLYSASAISTSGRNGLLSYTLEFKYNHYTFVDIS